MNCSRFQNKYESGSEPKGASLAHLEACEKCRLFANQEESLTRLLSVLPDMEAPADFQTAVRSRIASRGIRNPVWGAARVVFPAAALLLIAAFVVTNSNLFVSREKENGSVAEVKDPVLVPDKNTVVEQAKEQTGGTAPESDPLPNSVKTDLIDESGKEAGQKPSDRLDSAVKALPKGDSRGIRSLDQASEEADVSNPPGLDPDGEIKPTRRVPDKSFTAREILGALGVEAAWENGRLVVESIAENSIGDRSGLKTGDQVLSIDGRKVTPGTISKGSVNGQIIEVRRGGKDVTINIGSN